jgi:hypothetical protein
MTDKTTGTPRETPSGLAGNAGGLHRRRIGGGGVGRGGEGIICPAGEQGNKEHAPELHFRVGRQFAAFLLHGAQHVNFAANANDSVLGVHICSYPLPEPISQPTGQGPIPQSPLSTRTSASVAKGHRGK